MLQRSPENCQAGWQLPRPQTAPRPSQPAGATRKLSLEANESQGLLTPPWQSEGNASSPIGIMQTGAERCTSSLSAWLCLLDEALISCSLGLCRALLALGEEPASCLLTLLPAPDAFRGYRAFRLLQPGKLHHLIARCATTSMTCAAFSECPMLATKQEGSRHVLLSIHNCLQLPSARRASKGSFSWLLCLTSCWPAAESTGSCLVLLMLLPSSLDMAPAGLSLGAACSTGLAVNSKGA